MLLYWKTVLTSTRPTFMLPFIYYFLCHVAVKRLSEMLAAKKTVLKGHATQIARIFFTISLLSVTGYMTIQPQLYSE